MKLKYNNSFLLFVSLFLILLQISSQSNVAMTNFLKSSIVQRSPWCWTKPANNDPNFKVTPNGGYNWGFVNPNSEGSEMLYTIEMHTSKREKSGTNSYIYIKILGSQSASDWLLLSYGIIEVGSIVKKTVSIKDVGQLFRIKLKVVGNQPYRPVSVKIFVKNGIQYSFECLKQIEPCKPNDRIFSKCVAELQEDGNVSYNFIAKTKDEPDAGYEGMITVSLLGTKGKTSEKLVTETGCEKGSTIEANIKSYDIGDIVGYKMELKDKGSWRPSLIKITSNITGIFKSFEITKQMVYENQQLRAMTFNYYQFSGSSSSSGGSSSSSSSSGGSSFSSGSSSGGGSVSFNGIGGGDANIFGQGEQSYSAWNKAFESSGGGRSGDATQDDFNKIVNQMSPPPTPDGRTQVGALMSKEESKKLIELTCEQELVNPSEDNQIFGPDFPGGNVQFYSLLAKCPRCDKATGIVYGVGIHPEKTPICLAAIIDKAISLSAGGIIAINVFSALKKYPVKSNWSKFGTITIKPYFEQAKKSFTLAKVDNIDLVEKDIRIVDNKGNISNEGRIEFRVEGVWGTLCFKGVNKESAIRICKDLDFNYGEWKNPIDKENNDFCKKFKGEDYCGSVYTKAFFKELTCNAKATSINECDKKMANEQECDHTFDSILSCSNEDPNQQALLGDRTTENGSCRLDSPREINGEYTGRLELFEKQKWGSLCNDGFNNDAADVACRTMGYDSGKWVNDQSANEFKKPVDDNTPFTGSKMECNGGEKNLKGCSYQKENVMCKHDKDVVISCKGKKGDPSGKSQSTPPSTNPPPDLGRLGIDTVKLTCNDNFRLKKYFRGDPGSVWIAECPPGCDKSSGIIWGSGIYDSQSKICAAAIHSGVISKQDGGSFALVKSFGQKYLEGSNNQEISSTTSELGCDVSFTFTKKYANYDAYSGLLKSNILIKVENKKKAEGDFLKQILNKAAEAIDQSQPPSPRQSRDYHAENPISDNGEFLISSKSVSSDAKNINNAISFLESEISLGSYMESKNIDLNQAAYKWVEAVGTHKFNEFGSVFVENSPIKALENTYTIFSVFEMDEFTGQDAFIMSYSGCGGFNLWINGSGSINVGDACNDQKKINLGLTVPLHSKSYFYMQYNNTKITAMLRIPSIENPTISPKQFKAPIPKQNNLCIGCMFSSKNKFFNGSIDFIIIFEDLIDSGMMPHIIDAIEKNKKISDNTNDHPITNDGRKCVSSPNKGPTPGEENSPSEPPESKIPLYAPQIDQPNEQNATGNNLSSSGQSNNPNTTQNQQGKNGDIYFRLINDNKFSFLEHRYRKEKKGNLTPNAIGGGEEKSGNSKEDSGSKGSAIPIDCKTNGMDKRFKNMIGNLFRVKCPSCGKLTQHMVFGTIIYHPNSSICRAAIHSGTLPIDSEGEVILEIMGKQPTFNGVPSNGIFSSSIGAEEYSMRLQKAPPLRQISCNTKGTDDEFGVTEKNIKMLVVCPKGCLEEKVIPPIYGSEIYADISSICVSAIHSGIIGKKGGEIQFMFSDGKPEYKGTQGFGVMSLQLDSQIRSFSFVGSNSSIFYNFKEDFRGNFNQKWKEIKGGNVMNASASNWGYFVRDNWINKYNKKELNHSISFTGKIKVPSRGFDFATHVKFIENEAEFANGKISVNLMTFKAVGKVGILFRYKDINNHYGLLFDYSDKANNVKLYKKTEGSLNIIKAKFLDIVEATWYRYDIYLDYNNIRITVQMGEIRENKQIFNTSITGIQRGTIALAVDDIHRVFFGGIEISDWKPSFQRDNLNKNVRCSVEKIHNSLTLEKRKAYCRKIYKGATNSEAQLCTEPHMYCFQRCDQEIPKKEAISNYCCINLCINKIKELDKPPVLGTSKWEPKIGEKVDYIPKGDTLAVAAEIISIKDGEEKDTKSVTMKYVTPEGDETTTDDTFISGSKNIIKCGQFMTLRKDCNK